MVALFVACSPLLCGATHARWQSAVYIEDGQVKQCSGKEVGGKSAGFGTKKPEKWDKKYLFLKTNRGCCLESTKDYTDSQKRTGKRSWDVVENTYLWKKRT